MKKKVIALMFGLLLLAAPIWALDVTLIWDANTEPDLAGYVIYQADRMGNKTGPWAQIDTTTTNTYIVTGLPNGQNFAWLVTAIDLSGNESFASNMVELYDRTAPLAPLNLDKQ